MLQRWYLRRLALTCPVSLWRSAGPLTLVQPLHQHPSLNPARQTLSEPWGPAGFLPLGSCAFTAQAPEFSAESPLALRRPRGGSVARLSEVVVVQHLLSLVGFMQIGKEREDSKHSETIASRALRYRRSQPALKWCCFRGHCANSSQISLKSAYLVGKSLQSAWEPQDKACHCILNYVFGSLIKYLLIDTGI